MGENEKELMLAIGSDPENFQKAMGQITKTQRTIGAISIAIEYSFYAILNRRVGSKDELNALITDLKAIKPVDIGSMKARDSYVAQLERILEKIEKNELSEKDLPIVIKTILYDAKNMISRQDIASVMTDYLQLLVGWVGQSKVEAVRDKRQAAYEKYKTIISGTQQFLLNGVDPFTLCYGQTTKSAPIWAAGLKGAGGTAGTSLGGEFGTGGGVLDKLDQFKKEHPYANFQMPGSSQGAIDFVKTDLDNKATHMKIAQRAFDGIEVAIKRSLFTKNPGIKETGISTYFEGLDWGTKKADIAILESGNSTPAQINAAIKNIFAAISENSAAVGGEAFEKLVVDANFGENGSALNLLFGYLGTGSSAYLKMTGMEKVQNFYLSVVDKFSQKGFKLSIWEEISQKQSSVADRLMNEEMLLPGQDASNTFSMKKDRFSLATAVSYMYAYENSSFMRDMKRYEGRDADSDKRALDANIKKLQEDVDNFEIAIQAKQHEIDLDPTNLELKEQMAALVKDQLYAKTQIGESQMRLSAIVNGSEYDRYFAAITGGGARVPDAIPSTILQNTASMQQLYNIYRFDFDSFLAMAGQVMMDVSSIYNSPHGTEFNIKTPMGDNKTSSRFDAASNFMERIGKLPDASLLDFQVYLLLHSNYYQDIINDPENKIELNDIAKYIMVYGLPADVANISKLKALDPRSDLNDLQKSYQDYLGMVTQLPGIDPIYILDPGRYFGQNLGEIILPQTYMNAIRDVFESLSVKFEDFHAQNIAGDGLVHRISKGNLERQDRIDVKVTGQGASSTDYEYENDFSKGATVEQKQQTHRIRAQNVNKEDAPLTGLDWRLRQGMAEKVDSYKKVWDQYGGSIIEDNRDWQLNASLNMVSPGDIVMVTNNRKIDQTLYSNTSLAEQTEQYDNHTIIYQRNNNGSGYSRVALDRIQTGSKTLQNELDDEVVRYFIQNRTKWATGFTTESAVEVQDKKTNNPLEASEQRIGGVFGFELGRTKKVSGTVVKTVDGNAGAAFSYKISSTKLVTVGYVDISNRMTNWQQKLPEQMQEANEPITGSSQYSYGKNAFAAYQVLGKFYGIITGGERSAGGAAQWKIGDEKYGGAGLLVYYKTAKNADGESITTPERVLGSASYVSNKVVVNTSIDLTYNGPADEQYGGMITRIELGAGKYLTLTGMKYRDNGNSELEPDYKNLLEKISDLSGRTGATAQDPDFASLDPYAQKAIAAGYQNEIVTILREAQLLNAFNFVNDQRTNISIAFEDNGKLRTKLSLSQIGDSKDNYLIGMTDVGNNLSFTGGVNINSAKNGISDLVGAKIGTGNTTYIFMAYDLKKQLKHGSEGAAQVTISHLYDKRWVVGGKLGGKLMPGSNDFNAELFIGNDRFRFKTGAQKVGSINDQYLAFEKYLTSVHIFKKEMEAMHGGSLHHYTAPNVEGGRVEYFFQVKPTQTTRFKVSAFWDATKFDKKTPVSELGAQATFYFTF